MMTYPHLAYAVTEGFCIIYALTILTRLNGSIGTEHQVRQLRNMIYAYLVMMVTDIFWALIEDDILVPPHFLNMALNAATVLSLSLGCYFWFRFIMDRLYPDRVGRDPLDFLIHVPIVFICVLDVATVFTNWLFFIDENGHFDNAPLFVLQSIVNNFYLLIPSVISLWRAFRAHSKSERVEYLTYSSYMTVSLLSGLLEEVLGTVPVLALSIFMIIHLLFVMIQNMQIYNDALTDLNNRRRLNQFLAQCLLKASAEHPVTVFLLDINGFKAINDTFGHIAGDNALKIFAGVLKATAARYSAFIARYGGDEFCMVMEKPETVPQEVTGEIARLLGGTWGMTDSPSGGYRLSASIGWAVCISAAESPEAVLSRADEALYANKQEWHRARA